MEGSLQKHLEKPREVAKMPTKPHAPVEYPLELMNSHLSISSMAKTRGKPRAPWDHTHEASHSISDLLKPSKPIAPTESSS